MKYEKKRFAACSGDLVKTIKHFPGFEQTISLNCVKTKKELKDISAILGWGRKKSGLAAQELSKRNGVPAWFLEEGFIRSVGLGVSGEKALSLVVDKSGIYYDSTRTSDLEKIISNFSYELDDELLVRSRQCIARIINGGISKYNSSSFNMPANWFSGKNTVLVVDQTRGDESVEYGNMHPSGFEGMLEAAILENPESRILVKTHPDVLAGKKSGYLTSIEESDRVFLIREHVNPIEILKKVDHVYTVTSQLGFEALMAGKKVTCFGVPFYSGWGVTDDRCEVSRRGKRRTVEQLFAAAYILYPTYVDPDTHSYCEIEHIIEHFERNRKIWAVNSGKIYCFGFTFWKRGFVRRFLASPGNNIVFCRNASDAEEKGFDKDSKIVVWGFRNCSNVKSLTEKFHVPVWRMEDGFFRSVGLGSDFTAPASLVLDREGIYFDPRSPSELEFHLNQCDFSDNELLESKKLILKICDSKVTKYQIGKNRSVMPVKSNGRKVILIPGQVDDDASVAFGSVDIKSNSELIHEVRKGNPSAYIIYKPHPEVIAGNRRGIVETELLKRCCDQVVYDAILDACLDECDEVHTLTSTVGFDALLRGKKVVTYGIPFYAGWGLTMDRHVVKRRSRKLSLEELVAGCLIRYPRYINWKTGHFTTAGYTINILANATRKGGVPSSIRPLPVKYFRKAKFLCSAVWREAGFDR